jgi:glycosyltransferase involved in cell wall biosynthesis
MKVCIVHNEYGIFSGEEAVVHNLQTLLKNNRHQVFYFQRTSSEIPGMRMGKVRAFFSGLFSFSSKKAMHRCIQKFEPDVVHVHNLFPLISASVLGVCRRAGVPVVMSVHNYRLMCPNGLLMTKGRICEKCCGGREYWCVLKNCENNLFKSIGYALRSAVTRKLRMFKDNVSIFACLSDFQRKKIIEDGFPEKQCVVLPNMVMWNEKKEDTISGGEYVAYVGRISPEKGVETLIEAARNCPAITFKAAGNYDRMQHLPAAAPGNFQFLGILKKGDVNCFISGSRIVIFCSVCFETFGVTMVEAMLQGKPVVASRLGGIPEIVEDGKTGLLFEAGNAEDLKQKVEYLWNRPELCKKMGAAGRDKALSEYSAETYYQRLMTIYEQAGQSCGN